MRLQHLANITGGLMGVARQMWHMNVSWSNLCNPTGRSVIRNKNCKYCCMSFTSATSSPRWNCLPFLCRGSRSSSLSELYVRTRLLCGVLPLWSCIAYIFRWPALQNLNPPTKKMCNDQWTNHPWTVLLTHLECQNCLYLSNHLMSQRWTRAPIFSA